MYKILDYLSRKYKFHLKAEGRSMLPIIFPGDVVYLQRCKFSGLAADDIILVKKGKNGFIHRVIYKNDAFLISKGDNNPSSDGKIYPSQVRGRAYQIKRNGQLLDLETIYLWQSTLYFQEIVKIKKAFGKNGVNFVFLKGLPLHLYLIKSHPRRIYADCDVLVGRKDYQKAEKLLLKNGFQKSETAYSQIHKLLKDKPTEFTFYKMINSFPVFFDVHLEVAFLMNQIGRLEALYPQRLIDDLTDKFLKEKQMINIHKESFPILSLENLVIYLALHFFHHNFCGAFRLELLDKVIRNILQIPSPRSPSADGSHASEVFLSLSEKILKYRLQNFIYPVFLLLQKYFATPLPRNYLVGLQPKKNVWQYIKKKIVTINIFNSEARFAAGIARFKNIFFLSPRPLWMKWLIFFSPAVFYSVVWSLWRKFFRKAVMSADDFFLF